MDTLLLSRIQFGANISFHILFPSITLALGWMLLFFKLRFSLTGQQKWMQAYMFWVKVFALSFAMGVVSGITMSFQFGTNWPGFMEKVGNIAGPLLAYEILTAFFLEAVFLGIMLFGASRVKSWVHTLATFLVAFGTTMSAFWIIVLNSWMHTPQGFTMIDGVAHATSWLEIVFNPSMPYRFVHMLLASGLTVAFLIAGVSALRMLWGERGEDVKTALRVGIITAASLIPLQILAGDFHGLNTLKHQPAKLAAMEANWETGPNVPLVLFALPDETTRENRFEIAVPNAASLILTHSLDGTVPGLNDFVDATGQILHPPVAPVFFSFRIMVGVGLAMLLLSWSGLYLMRRHSAASLPKPALLAFSAMSFSGWIATLAGWYTTEIGRQPWLVQGVMTTQEAVAEVPATLVLSTLIGYLLLYALLVLAYIGAITYLARTAARSAPRLSAEPTEETAHDLFR
ncbi:cytochrome ubiquinol oxidase subunit I [uncultured Lentibacter sp.]|uniref:cytochrome ubiquinol oxidase subunit I n=1 Tax=uncultured Lentibacter sp. TaxID=1659309 RepID=UPI00262A4606|nr:cytochrome ubiquinol oxidase subunit I [uncultured Lentibacter sp.]